MRTTFFGLEVARKGLNTQRKALDVTSHNIANANTQGYTRQDAIMSATNPWSVPSLNKPHGAGQLGTGSQVEEIRRLRDSFVDLQVRNENKHLGYWEAKQDTLAKLEVIVNEPSDAGIRSVMDQFWESWQELNNNPESLAVRSVVRQRGIAIAETLNHMDRQLRELQEDLDASIHTKVDELNSIARQIRDLNDQIVKTEITGDNANDLRDRRDLLLDQASKIADIRYIEDRDGSVRVTIGGKSLVTGNRVSELEMFNPAYTDGLFIPRWKDGTPLNLESGNLLGLLESRDQVIGQFKKDLDYLAYSLVTTTNEIHAEGYGLDNKSGYLFFNQPEDGAIGEINAGSISLADNILKDLNTIAAATMPELPGDGTNAMKLAQLKHTHTIDPYGYLKVEGKPLQLADINDFNFEDDIKTFTINGEDVVLDKDLAVFEPDGPLDLAKSLNSLANSINSQLTTVTARVNDAGNGIMLLAHENIEIGGTDFAALGFEAGENRADITGTFDDFYRGVVAGIGVDSQEATRMVENQALLVAQQENRREIMSGVSLDEEMANMIKFQHAYNAAARTITAMDEMLDVLINRVGLVGR